MEDYLKAIYQLQRSREGRVKTSEIADELDVTSPTVTSMLEKLSERGLLDREKYKGVRLTPEGETIAVEIVRHHRLLETYLTEHLDYDWAEVHEEADRLEHHISEHFERRVADALGDPDVDPHGSPIPGEDLEPLETIEGHAVSEFEQGQRIVVEEVTTQDPEVLTYLADHDITPGTKHRITDVAPFGMITLESETTERTFSLPEDLAEDVRVKSISG